ncbi:MAG: hypothetical protein QUV07_05630 [Cyanobium sp. CZS 25K]|nr:hypothetical protein [Cyanobium sp. CZS25K]
MFSLWLGAYDQGPAYVGLIVNPGEPHSEYEAKVLRAAAKRDSNVVETSVVRTGPPRLPSV